MNKNHSVDEYIQSKPEAVRQMLAELRRTVTGAVPEAQESISYGMPTYKLNGMPLIYLAAWKNHVSLYPASPGLIEAFSSELADWEIEKSTIRIPLNRPLSIELISRIAKFRAMEVGTG